MSITTLIHGTTPRGKKMKKLSQFGLVLLTYGFAAAAYAAPGNCTAGAVCVDEPGTLVLLTVGLATAVAVARKFRK
jgi:hypothetical protein